MTRELAGLRLQIRTLTLPELCNAGEQQTKSD
jgi:hypothetical protein